MLRKLEIGPGKRHLKGYETVGMEFSDVKCDVSGPLPYDDGVFDEVLASHVIEHIEWSRTQAVLTEWARVLKRGGTLKVWTPDLMAVIETIVKAETGHEVSPEEVDAHVNMMKSLNADHDPYIWANYRIMSAENPKAAVQYHKCHRSMFTYGHLKNQMQKAGLHDICRILSKPPYDHGRANLGVCGLKY